MRMMTMMMMMMMMVVIIKAGARWGGVRAND